jgi:hypothetical protein
VKESAIRRLQIVLYLVYFVLAAAMGVIAFTTMGCSSTTETFSAPKLQPVAFAIPVPPSERTCVDPTLLQLGALSLEQVEADGSVLIQACTQDVLVLLEDAEKDYRECIAHNEARQLVIQAEREAREELERLKAGADDGE